MNSELDIDFMIIDQSEIKDEAVRALRYKEMKRIAQEIDDYAKRKMNNGIGL